MKMRGGVGAANFRITRGLHEVDPDFSINIGSVGNASAPFPLAGRNRKSTLRPWRHARIAARGRVRPARWRGISASSIEAEILEKRLRCVPYRIDLPPEGFKLVEKTGSMGGFKRIVELLQDRRPVVRQ